MKNFGLIGKSLVHSFSKNYFEEKFKRENIRDSKYDLFELGDISEVIDLIEKSNLSGLNVTIPFKESIIPFLAEIDATAKEIGAVNTLKIENNSIKGYNTDIIGFKKSIRPFLAKEHNRALILGTGGASKAIAVALKQYDIPFFFCSTSKQGNNIISYSDLNEENIQQFPLIINCTPLGTFPNVEEHPPIPVEGIGKNHLVFDLIYNPVESKLLSIAKQNGALNSNGLNMLKIQAEESWKIWNE